VAGPRWEGDCLTRAVKPISRSQMNDGYGADSGPSGGDPRRPACDVPGAHPQRPLNVDSRRSIAWDEFCAPGRFQERSVLAHSSRTGYKPGRVAMGPIPAIS
jgi:hypothetical protein